MGGGVWCLMALVDGGRVKEDEVHCFLGVEIG